MIITYSLFINVHLFITVDGSLWVNGKKLAENFGKKYLPLDKLSTVTIRIDMSEKTLTYFINGVCVGIAFGPKKAAPAVAFPLAVSSTASSTVSSTVNSTKSSTVGSTVRCATAEGHRESQIRYESEQLNKLSYIIYYVYYFLFYTYSLLCLYYIILHIVFAFFLFFLIFSEYLGISSIGFWFF